MFFKIGTSSFAVCWLCPVPGDSLGDNRRSVLSNIGTKKNMFVPFQARHDLLCLSSHNSEPSYGFHKQETKMKLKNPHENGCS